jgi:hypothetical protein
MEEMNAHNFNELAADLQKYRYDLDLKVRNAVRKAFGYLTQPEKDLLTAFYAIDSNMNHGKRNQILANKFEMAVDSVSDKLRKIRHKVAHRVLVSGEPHVPVQLLLQRIKDAKTTDEALVIASLIDVRLLPGFSSWDCRAQKLAMMISGSGNYSVSYGDERDVTKVCFPLRNLLTENREQILRYHEIGEVTIGKLQKALLKLGFELEFLKPGKQRSLTIM